MFSKLKMEVQSTCQYCNKTFSSIYSLKKHLTSAKYCLSKRVVTDDQVSNFPCVYCKKIFTQKVHLQTHTLTCKNILFDEMVAKYESMEIENQRLKLELENANKSIHELEIKLAREDGRILELKTAKPQTIQKVKNSKIYINPKLADVPIHNIEPLTTEYIRDNIHSYTYDLFLKGPIGIVEFLEPLIRVYDEDDIDAKPCRNYVCTDIPRNKYYKLMRSKEWEIDSGASFLNEVINELKGRFDKHYAKVKQDDENETKQIMANPNFTLEQLNESTSSQLVLSLMPMNKGISKTGKARTKLLEDIRHHMQGITCI